MSRIQTSFQNVDVYYFTQPPCINFLSCDEKSLTVGSVFMSRINNNNASIFILRRLHPMTTNEPSPPCERRRITFNDDGQRVQLARPELPAPHYICMYRLIPTTAPSRPRHYYPRFIACTIYHPERMDSLVS